MEKEMPGVTPSGTPYEVPQREPKDVPPTPDKKNSGEDNQQESKKWSSISDPDISDSVC